MNQQAMIRVGVTVFVLFIIIVTLSGQIFLTINPGTAGILFKRFGGGLDKEHVMTQGFHIIAPWNKVFEYDIREQQIQENLDVLSSNGLSINIDISIRFNPVISEIGDLYEKFAQDYRTRLVVPEVRSSVRKIIGRYTPEELYSSKREQVQTEIYDETYDILTDNHIELQALLIRSVKLPPSIQAAIERKLQQEQESLEYEFRLEKERKEAERKKIEAQGVREFQEIVSQGINDDYLRWKGIEATQELSKSENSKIVIIGSGSDGLPIILNTD